jgi:hypothetical protein
MFNLHKQAQAMAQEAWDESSFDTDHARDFLHESCDGSEITVYYGKAIEFCANNNTDSGESYLEDFGGIAQPGDCFGQIACRIAFATLLCTCEGYLAEIAAEHEGSE